MLLGNVTFLGIFNSYCDIVAVNGGGCFREAFRTVTVHLIVTFSVDKSDYLLRGGLGMFARGTNTLYRLAT